LRGCHRHELGWISVALHNPNAGAD
jgi:hypothetical protein